MPRSRLEVDTPDKKLDQNPVSFFHFQREKWTKFRVEPGQSYRLQVDETVYVVGRWVRWQIQREVVGRYDYTKDCGQQGRAVHPNGIHLLVTNLKEKELRMTILAVLDTGERLFVRTEETEDGGIGGHDVMMIAIWGGVILGQETMDFY